MNKLIFFGVVFAAIASQASSKTVRCTIDVEGAKEKIEFEDDRMTQVLRNSDPLSISFLLRKDKTVIKDVDQFDIRTDTKGELGDLNGAKVISFDKFDSYKPSGIRISVDSVRKNRRPDWFPLDKGISVFSTSNSLFYIDYKLGLKINCAEVDKN